MWVRLTYGSHGSIHKEGAGELDVVEGSGEFTAFAIHIGLHVGDAIVGLFPGQVLEEQRCSQLTMTTRAHREGAVEPGQLCQQTGF